MYLIPYGFIQIKTKLSSQEIEKRLNNEVEQQRLVSGMFRGNHKYFEGEVSGKQFKINPVIKFRNSFNPVVIGEIHEKENFTVVEMVIRLHLIVVWMLLSFFIGLFSIMVLPDISLYIRVLLFGEGKAIYENLPPGYLSQIISLFVIQASIFYLFVIVFFNIEARKVVKYLLRVFDGQEIAQQ